MICSKQDLKDYIAADRKANGMERYYWLKLLYGNDNARAFRYLKSLRKLEYAKNTNSIFYHFWRWYNRQLSLKYGVGLFPNTIGKGLRLPHLVGGVILNCKQMGDWCTVNGGVVVGNKGKQENIATIGNRVDLAIGCKVIGKVTIGDNAVIAPNSVVVKDVPANAVVSGVPAQIIKIKE